MLDDDADAEAIAHAFERLRTREVGLFRVPEPLRAFAEGMAPLASGETVVAALPFALSIR
jgi:hypothetical protein